MGIFSQKYIRMIKNNDDMFCIYNLKEDKNVETNSVRNQ